MTISWQLAMSMALALGIATPGFAQEAGFARLEEAQELALDRGAVALAMDCGPAEIPVTVDLMDQDPFYASFKVKAQNGMARVEVEERMSPPFDLVADVFSVECLGAGANR
jgi:hypothetical protein